MLRVVLSPQWFLTPDIIIGLFSFLVLFVFTVISLKYYLFSKNKKFVYMGLAFFLLGLGELSRVVMNLGLYFHFPVTYQIGKIIVTSQVVKSLDIVYYVGFFIHRFLVMLGFYFIYYITKKKKSMMEHLLILYFIIVAAIFTSDANYIFNITVALLLTVIYINYQSIYRETRAKNTRTLSYGFLILLASYLIFIFSKFSGSVYILANLLQLVAYLVFLFVIINIYKHKSKYGKKK